MAETDILDIASTISSSEEDVASSIIRAVKGTGKKTATIAKFDGGINTRFHKKDIPDDSFEAADNAMFDTVGKVRIGGIGEDLGLDSVLADSAPGYGLFTFSHDFTNPNTGVDSTSKNTNIEHGGSTGYFSEEDGSVLQVATQTGQFELTDEVATDNPPFVLPNTNTASPNDNGWQYDTTNHVIWHEPTDSTIYYQYAVSKTAIRGRAYLVDVIGDGKIAASGNNSRGEVVAEGVGYTGSAKIFIHDGKSVSSSAKTLTAGSTRDIIVVGETSNGNIGIGATPGFGGRITRMIIYEVPAPEDISYIVQQNGRYFNFLDTRLTSWRTNDDADFEGLPLNTDLENEYTDVKPQYYCVDGTVRVYDANFKNKSKNKWYGFVDRQHFLNTMIENNYGSVTNTYLSGAWIRQWVEEDQELYPPSKVEHTSDNVDGACSLIDYTTQSTCEGNNGVWSNGNPGRAVINNEGIGKHEEHNSSTGKGGIEIHVSYLSSDDEDVVEAGASFQGAKYTYHLSYLYDLSEQESPLYALQEGDDADVDTFIHDLSAVENSTALYISVTVDYNNVNGGYAFNKRIVGARLYYNNINDTEVFYYHLLDIDFKEGVRKTGDEDFTAWGTNIGDDLNPSEHNGVVECPFGSNHDYLLSIMGDANQTNIPKKDGTYHFQFNTPTTHDFYSAINLYEPADKTYFRFKTAVVSDKRLWVANIGEVDSNGVVVKRFGDRLIRCPQGKFDTMPMEAINMGKDIGINDGDNIIKLEYIKDKLLIFKRFTLFILNVQGQNEYVEEERRFLGISHPSSSIKTEFGISWVNDRGCYLYTGSELINLTENKIDSEEWKNYIGENPLIGYITHKRQAFIVRDSSLTGDDTFYIYDYSTQSWSKNVGGIGMSPKSNIINVHDVNGVYNGNAIYSTLDQDDSTEDIIVNQASASTETVSTNYSTGGGGGSVAVTKGVIGEYSSGTITIGWTGEKLLDAIGLSNFFYLCYGFEGEMAIDNPTTGTLTDGTFLTPILPVRDVANLSTKSEVANYINQQINNHTGVSTYTSEVSGNVITITKNIVGTTDNRDSVLVSHNGASGTYTLQTRNPSTITSSTILGGVAAVNHAVQIGIAGVTDGSDTTVNRFGFTITDLDENSWKNKITKYKEGGKTVLIEHKGGSDTSLYLGGASGDDTTNQLVAEDLRARTYGNPIVTDSTVGFGITVSDVIDSGYNDVNNDDIYYFSLSRATPFEVRTMQTSVNTLVREFTNENKSNVGSYKLITKEFDFGEPSVRKKIYKVYITFRSVFVDNKYSDSGVKVYYGTDGKDITSSTVGTEFSAASSKYYSTVGGLTALDSSSDFNTALNDASNINPTDLTITLDSTSNVHENGVIQIDDEQMLVTGVSGSDATVEREWAGTVGVGHDDNATVLVARADQYVTAELKPPSGINNVKSFQLKLESFGVVPAKFEVNDITIIYRMKNVR